MMRAGTGTQIINPPLGVSLGGYFYERPCSGICDDLLAKSVVLDDGSTKVSITVCDLQAVEAEEVRRAREIAHRATGISPDSIMISATHTHTGPQVRRGRAVPVSEEYLSKLPEMIASSIIKAHDNLQPATLRLGEEYEDRIAFNRRYRMKDGSVRFNPPKQDPNILGPDGPIDPQVNVLRIDGEDGMPTAILANYALHPDVLGGCEASADFPGEMARIVSDIYESKPLVVFMQGACGNINHRDVSKPDSQTGRNEVERIARVLAGKVLAASELSQPMDGTLGVRKSILKIPYHPLTESLREKAAAVRSNPTADSFDKAQAKAIENYSLDGKLADVEVQAIRIAGTAVVGIPGELFVEYGISIKEWSPFRQTFVVELANNTFGYIPTQDAFCPGTYETMPIVSAMLEPSAGVIIANAAGELLKTLA
ncbi:MAG: hypothetical protein K6T99_05620 [Armatimonadetes bacterium]|nr:hypothetical protein [Armatimonadota bacterium]